MAGGPGIPSTPSAPETVTIFAYVLKHRDLVMYDQRGTGASNLLYCDLRQADKPEERGDFLPASAVSRCYQRIVRRADPAQYNTSASVGDLEDLRAALGYRKLTLHALSYGTRLSEAYMEAYPANVRAAIFEGALQPASITAAVHCMN
jgi:pimeloyl-ACP methyl ester carboxylesterase